MYSLQTLIQEWAKFAQDKNIPRPPNPPPTDIQFNRFIEDSREIKSGDCFVARVRPYSDGHPFIQKAIDNGAVCVISEKPLADLTLTVPASVLFWHVPDTAVTLSWLAASAYGFPAQHLTTIGITGTDGKTSVCNMTFEILQAAGLKSGLISTIRAVIGETESPTGLHVTTPQAPQIQAYLREMVDAGLTHCILETTSMGLAEHRADSALFDIGAVTNVQHEHLDYHGSWEQYLADKGRLMELADKAVINADDESYKPYVAQKPSALTYGIDADAHLRASKIKFRPDATHFLLETTGLKHEIKSHLVGKFNVSNMLCAAGIAQELGITANDIKTGLENVQLISGRMERISEGQDFHVIVDFAHTPNALKRAIEAARGMTDGKIITVFGSAGRRDVQKRRIMAEVSQEYADLTVLTAEDPRQEPLDEILQMMADGCVSHGGVELESFWRVQDRGRAIYMAFELVESPDDLVLICGKGHEQSMCFMTTEFPWDDRDATRAALKAFLIGKEMENLGLPTY